MTGKSGLNHWMYQPFYDILKRHVEIKDKKVSLSTEPNRESVWQSHTTETLR